jgi:hypothetical protein
MSQPRADVHAEKPSLKVLNQCATNVGGSGAGDPARWHNGLLDPRGLGGVAIVADECHCGDHTVRQLELDLRIVGLAA